MSNFHPRGRFIGANIEVKLATTDARVSVAHEHLKRLGYLVSKPDLAFAISHAMQAELRAFEIEHKGVVR